MNKPRKVAFIHDGPVFYDDNGLYYEYAYHRLYERYRYLGDEITFAVRTYPLDYNRKYTIIPAEVSIVRIPNINSASGIIKNLGETKKILEDLVSCYDVFILRVPSIIPALAQRYIEEAGKPYITECVGCSWDAYWNRNLYGKVMAPILFNLQRSVIKKSHYVVYVTKHFLQKRYPTKGKSISCSNVVIDEVNSSTLEERTKHIKDNTTGSYRLGTAAAIDVKYKGQADVIRAIYELNREGYNFSYILAGGFLHKENSGYLEDLVERLDMGDYVEFIGSLSSDEMDSFYDSLDIYIQPSKQEGLPRAVIEAMSRGCPVIGSNAGGTPELLEDAWIFRKGNIKDIKKKLKKLIGNDMIVASKRNMDYSRNYTYRYISEKRNKFYDVFLEENMNGRTNI